MHIIHITKACHALTTGGTERYVLELIRGLECRGWQNSIGWIWNHVDRRRFVSDGVRIVPLHTLSARIDPVEREFTRDVVTALFQNESPDLLHFHTFGMAEAAIAELASKRGIPYAFTYHSPAWTCRRETLLLWGEDSCDGEVRTLRCSACKLQERLNGSPLKGYAGAGLSALFGWPLARFTRGKLRRRTAFVSDTHRFRHALREFLFHCSLAVSLCDWTHSVLEANGADPHSIFHCPHGVPEDFVHRSRNASGEDDHKDLFVVGYVGRLTPVKGIHILVDAFRRTDYPKARLRLYGWSPSASVAEYVRSIEEMAAQDPRVEFVPKLAFERMMEEYQHLSLLAIPSVWMETGPFVLLEALQLGVPVWGSNHIGQLSLLRERGRIIEPNTPEVWARALEQAFDAHNKLPRRRAAWF